jgi:predicted ATPase/class 3 adenylate cyclase
VSIPALLAAAGSKEKAVTELPTGTVTFLFTDLESSTRLWEQHPAAMKAALARHDETLRAAVASAGGSVVKTTGDGVHAVFGTARDAVVAAWTAQRRLDEERWVGTGPLRARMGIHTGEAECREGDYFGPALNRAARLMAAAQGGQVVVSHATEELLHDALPEGLEMVDLGEHRLRDLSRPERVFQLVGAGLETQFAPLRSLEAFPSNLPPQLTSFVGRVDDLDEVAAALDSTRVVTLTGVGGVGKTRLALQVAAEVLPRYREGAWLIELGPVGEPDAVVEVLASTLGIQQHPGRTLAESVVETLRAQQLLLVVDNCEHVLDASAALVDSVLRACPQVAVLATSREALDVAGERAKRVRSLAVPGPGELDPAVLAVNDAVRLFVDRARDVRAGFALDASTATAVAQICARLDGIPLAIELAAARVASLQPTDIAARLDERFRLLTGGRRTAVERHHTLRATVDWSYELLSQAEQTTFDRLGVFSGGFTLEAAERVIAGDGLDAEAVLDLLEGLVARSMVNLDESVAATRYELLETMRQYARERLEVGDADAWRRRHAHYYAQLAEECGLAMHGPEEMAARARLTLDLDNLRSAVTWSLDSARPGDIASALGIIAALAPEADAHHQIGVGTWALRAAPRADEASPGQRAAVLSAAAMFATATGDAEQGRRLANAALRDGPPIESPWPYLTYAALSVADANEGSLELAYQRLCNARRELEGSPIDPFNRAALTVLVTAWAAGLGHFPTARAEAEAGLALSTQSRSPSNLAVANAMVGWAFLDEDPPRALAALEESIRLIRAGANDAIYAMALSLAAIARVRDGATSEAMRELREALTHCTDRGLVPMTATTLAFYIEVLTQVGHPEAGAVLAGVIQDGPFKALVSPAATGRDRNEILSDIKANLGPDAFAASYERGTQLSQDEAIAYALNETKRVLAEDEPAHRRH